jgi:drug/metabolite transporter (DMT)-like permease
MNRDPEHLAARAAPAIFVVLWSTGFIATKSVVNNADPLTYLAIRMALVVVLMAVIVAVVRPRWPDRIGVFHSAPSRAFWSTASISAAPRSRLRIRFRPGCPR